jgi:hypothetical protein
MLRRALLYIREQRAITDELGENFLLVHPARQLGLAPLCPTLDGRHRIGRGRRLEARLYVRVRVALHLAVARDPLGMKVIETERRGEQDDIAIGVRHGRLDHVVINL